VSIHAKVEELADPKAISVGAVYVTLDRLEDKGLISSRLSDPRPSVVDAPSATTNWKLWAKSAVTARRVWEAVAYA
jgi:sugar-specific transcriptional regulator TrmB